ncbi:MAG: hypothetical protein GX958_01910 [Desulfitobacterium sp.]|nr:hypothetical protein [Desulfitobacterium sp.]
MQKLKKSLSQLEYEFKLLEDTDLEGKADNIAKQMAIVEREVELAKNELEQMGEVGEDALQAVKDRQEELKKRIQEGTLAINNFEQSLKDLKETARQNWIKAQNDLYDAQQERLQALDRIQEAIVAIIRKRGEEEKKALEEAHKAEMDSLEKRHNERKKRYQEDLDEFRKYIQAKIDELDEQYEEEDYLEQLNKEREEANRLQREIDVLSLDDSLTARNKVIELRKQLAEQNEKIAKMQQKRERDLLKKSLQDQLKDKEEDAKEKEKIADELYENEKKRLEEEYRINKEFLERKYSDEQVYAEARESIMRGQVEVAQGVFEDIYDAYVDFENKFGRGMGILGDIIRDDFIEQLRLAQSVVEEMERNTFKLLPKYDSDDDPGDDVIGWRDPLDDNRGDYKEDNYGKLSSMSKQDYEKYVRYKGLWEQAKKQGDKAAMDAIHRQAQALRDKYGIKEDLYSYEMLKNIPYEKLKILGYDKGGKIDYTGFAMVHGEKDPEWILRDHHLQKIISDSVLSTIKVATPKIPNITAGQGIILQIDNFIKADTITKDSIPVLRQYENDAISRLKNELNKFGVRPARV